MLEELAVFLTVFPTVPMALFMLSVTSYYDLRSREIPLSVLVAMVPGVVASFVAYLFFSGAIFGARRVELASTAVVTATVVAVAYVLARNGQCGYGDVAISAMAGILSPYTVWLPVINIPAPMIVAVLVFGLAYVVAELATNIIHNFRRLEAFSKATEGCGPLEKAYFFVAGKVFTAQEFRSVKFYFPLLHEGMKRAVAKAGEEPLEGAGFQVKGGYVVATKGFPFATVLLTGYVLTMIYMALAGSSWPCR